MPSVTKDDVANHQQAPFISQNFERQVNRATRSVINAHLSSHGLELLDYPSYYATGSIMQPV